MKLYMTANSPYARKVRILARELGVADRIEDMAIDPRDPESGFWALNPIGKVPALELEDGRVLVESDLIAAWLARGAGDDTWLGPRFLADTERNALLGLANGALDRGMTARLEEARPGAEDSADVIEKNYAGIRRIFDAAEQRAVVRPDPDYADIALVTAVDWIALRHPVLEVHASWPGLSAYSAELSQRPAFAETTPKG